MKPKYFSKTAGRTSLLASFIIVGFAGQSALAADLVLKATDPANTSSFTSPLTGATASGWVTTVGVGTGVAATAGNNYFTSLTLRTPQAPGAFSFAGDALTVNTGGTLFIKSSSGSSATNIITANNLILNGGTVGLAFGTNDTVSVTLAGVTTVTGNSNLSAQGNGSNNSGSFEVLVIAAPIGGAAGTTLTIAGNGLANNNGVVRFSAANTYSGTVTVATPSSGFVASQVNRILQLNNLNAVQNATLNLTSVANGLTFAAGANTGAFNIGALTGASNQVLSDTAGNPVTLNIGGTNASSTYAGILSGAGGLVKSGNGTFTLTGAGTYAGTTRVSAGTLSLSSASLRNTSTVLIDSGAALNLTHGGTDRVAGLTIDNVPQPEGIYGPIGSGAANTTSAITGSGFLQVVASTAQDISLLASDAVGATSFNTNLHWSDALAPSAGNRYYTQAFDLRTPTTAGSFTFGGDSLSLDYGGRFIGKGAGTNTVQTVTVNNLILNGGFLFQSETNADTAVLNLLGSINVNVATPIGALGAPSNNSANFETLEIGSTISGPGSLTVAGTANFGLNTGVVKLSAANPYTGNITLQQPNFIASATNRLLQLNHLDALQNATLTLGTTAANGVSFASAANTGTFNIGALAGTANQSLADTAAAIVNLNVGGNGTTTTYSGALSGGGTLTKSGGGTLTLAGVNIHTGTTSINAGKIIFTNALQSIGGLAVADGAAVELKAVTTDATILTTTDLTLGSSGTTTLAFDFNNLNTAATLLTTGVLAANGTVNVTFANGNLLTTGIHPLIQYTSFTGTPLSGSFPLSPRSTGTLVNDTVNKFVNLNVTSDVPRWTGADNGNWQVGSTGPNKNWKLIDGNAPTDYIETDVVLFDDSATGTQDVVVSVANVLPTSVTFNTVDGYSLGGGFGIAGSAPLIKTGTGTLVVKNTNTFTGPTTISEGTLQIGDGSAAGSIAATSSILNNGTLVYNRAGSSTYGGVISGYGALVKSGSGTQTLTAANTYTGTTLVTAGVLANGINNTLGNNSTELTVSGGTYDLAGFDQSIISLSDGGSSAGTVTNSGVLKALVLNSGNDTTFSGEISGAVSIIKQGFGILTLPDSNSYTGATRLSLGTVAIGNNAALGTGTLEFFGGAIQSTDSTARTITNPINFGFTNSTFSGTGNLTFTATPPANSTLKVYTVDNPQTEFSGVLGGVAARTKEGSGLLIFSGLNNYTGTTTVNAGTLRITNPVLANAAAVVIADGAFLNLPHGSTDQVGSLTINGDLQPNGLYGAIGSGATYPVAAITGTGFLQVGPPGFAGFMDAYTTLTAAEKLPGADPDNDGISNLVEYALANFDPTVGNPSPGTLAGGVLSFTKRTAAVSNGDLSYAIEESTTLGIGSWTVAAPVVNDSTSISYVLPVGQPKEFARLRIIQN